MPPATIAAAASVAALSLFLTPAGEPPKPSPATPPRIEGTVRDATGKPVEKARVMARRTTGARPAALATASDAAGRFALALPAAGDYALRVEAGGWAPYVAEHVAVPGPALNVTLRKGALIEGTVRDARGRPVASARVEARESRWAARLPATALDPDAGRVRATTDARGVFRLEGLATAPHTVTASAAAGGARRNAVVPGTRIDLILTPGATVRGLVIGPGNQPLASAVVVAQPEGPGMNATIDRTDAAGRFEMSGLRAGAWRILATHAEAAPAVAPLALELNSARQVRLVLGPPARARGRLVDGEGRGVRGAVALQEIDGQPVAATLGETLRAESDEQGRFAVPGLPRTALSLRAEAQAFAPKRIDASPEGGELDLGDVVMEPGLAIRGRVHDDGGHPVADARVRAMAMMARGRSSLEATSGSDGTFVLAGAEPGFYRVEAEAAGYAGGNTRATAGGAPVEITIYRGGSITGTVVDAKGVGVPVFDVTAMPPEKEDGWTPAFGQGSDGRFELTDVGPAEYVLTVKSPDSAEAQVPRVTVRAGAATDVGRIRLSPGGLVRGRVTDAAGSPIAGASVWAMPGRRATVMMRSSGATAATDTAGAFELRGIEAGSVDVMAEHPDFATGRAAGVEVDPARGPAEARITLTRGGRIEGVVRRREGRPVDDARVQVAGNAPGMGLQLVTVAPDGSFSLDRLAPGNVRVMLTVNATGQGPSAGLARQVEVREGETTSVEFFLRETLVSGTITRRGEPAAGARLVLRGRTMFTAFGGPGSDVLPPPATGPQHGWAVARADGAYEMLVDEPGQYMALVTSADGRTNYPMRTIQVPDADAFTADLAFGGVPLSGRVVDAESGAPVPDASVNARAESAPNERPVPGASTMAGRDGSFQLEVEAGAVTVSARAEGYSAGRTSVTVGENGAADVRVPLARGLEIAGRVVDAAGKPVRGAFITAEPEGEHSEGPGPHMGFGQSGPDGTFTLTGLAEGRFRLGTSDETDGFAVLAGVPSGTRDALLRLAPGGEVRALVLRPDGSPAADVFVRIARVNGQSFWPGRPARTNASGVAELNVPAGTVELAASLDTATGSATVNVTAGGNAAVEIRLAPRRPGPGTP